MDESTDLVERCRALEDERLAALPLDKLYAVMAQKKFLADRQFMAKEVKRNAPVTRFRNWRAKHGQVK